MQQLQVAEMPQVGNKAELGVPRFLPAGRDWIPLWAASAARVTLGTALVSLDAGSRDTERSQHSSCQGRCSKGRAMTFPCLSRVVLDSPASQSPPRVGSAPAPAPGAQGRQRLLQGG